MGVYEGRGQVTKGLKELMYAWNETKGSWNDAISQNFEKKYLLPLEMDLRNAVGAMDHMGGFLSLVKRECE